jgi:imidazolonepropionase-like amidohydrolase/Tol biopolymer transport system component
MNTLGFHGVVWALCSGLLASGQIRAEEGESQAWDVAAPNYSVAPERVELDVREGTWMNVDVAPDGASVIFDLLGDIYRIPITGGVAEPLLSGHAWDIQPQISPDGRYLAFTSDRSGADNIWLKDLQDSAAPLQQITHEDFRLLNSPSWHPRGDYLVAKKHFTTSRSLGTGEIWLYHSDYQQQVERNNLKGLALVERPAKNFQKELGEPVFAVDGASIFYTQNVTPGNTFIYHQDSNGEVMAIKRYDLENGQSHIVVGGAGGAVRPTPSPDGKRLAFVKRIRAQSRLFVMDLQSGEQTLLVDDLDPDMQETWAVQGVYPTMDWTPDGQSIVYWAQGQIWRVDVASKQRTSIPFSIKDQRAVYPAVQVKTQVAPDTVTTKMPRFATSSPNGQDVVFESLGRLYIKSPNAEPRRLTRDQASGHEYSPVWSVDGKRIYFLRWSDQGLGEIRSVKARGGKSSVVLSTPAHYVELAINQAGDQLLFRQLSGSDLTHPNWGAHPGIYVYALGAEAAEFVSDRGRNPHFGPDGRIYATQRNSTAVGRGSDDARTELISMTSKGLDVRTHATAELANMIRLSPDGRYIAFSETGRLYVTAFPPTGKPIPLATIANSEAGSSAFLTQRISTQGGEYVHWSANSDALNWSVGATFNTQAIDQRLGQADGAAVQSIDLSMQVAADVPRGLLALTNARVITMDAQRQVIDRGTVLIKDNRILAVGDDVAIPAESEVLDLQGQTIVPGYIDAHAHGPYARGEIIPQQNWSLLAHLALGVTTAHNPSSRANQVFPAAEYQRVGNILGPRIFSTGEIIYGAKSTGFDPIESLEDAKAVVSRLQAQGAISVKNYNQPRRSQRQMVIEAARQAGLLVVAEGGSLYQMDMNLIADGSTGIEHNIPTLKIYDDVKQFWSQTKVGYTPTLVVTYGGLTSEDYFYQHTDVWKHPLLSRFVPPTVLQPRAVRRVSAPEADYRDDDAARGALQLMEQGVVVNIGAHGQREGLATHWEIWSFVRGGMSPMQALATATINPAHYLGMQDDLGSIEVGKLADLQVINGDPLADIRTTDQLSYVMLNGRLYRAADLAEQTTGNSTLEPLWWHEQPQFEIR